MQDHRLLELGIKPANRLPQRLAVRPFQDLLVRRPVRFGILFKNRRIDRCRPPANRTAHIVAMKVQHDGLHPSKDTLVLVVRLQVANRLVQRTTDQILGRRHIGAQPHRLREQPITIFRNQLQRTGVQVLPNL